MRDATVEARVAANVTMIKYPLLAIEAARRDAHLWDATVQARASADKTMICLPMRSDAVCDR